MCFMGHDHRIQKKSFYLQIDLEKIYVSNSIFAQIKLDLLR